MSIDNLEKKLNGELPVTREELKELIKSWGEINNYDQSVINVGMCYDLSKLDVSQITDMSSIFSYSAFNGNISNWDTSNVTTMESMFSGTKNFNQPLNFDTSNVKNMSYMFCNASSFNQELKFNTSKVTNMNYMFYNTIEFNQSLNFDTSNVISMKGMFYNAKSFNQPIIFDISKVTIMSYMFEKTKAFLDKYNSGEPLSNYTNEIKKWLNENREKMNMIDLKEKHGDEIDGFFSNIKNLTTQSEQAFYQNATSNELLVRKELHDNLQEKIERS